MDRRSLRLAPLVAAALLIAAPVAAQDPGAAVAYAGVGFTLAPELGASIAIVPVAAVPDGTSPIANPAHTSFAFSNVTQNQAERMALRPKWPISAYSASAPVKHKKTAPNTMKAI